MLLLLLLPGPPLCRALCPAMSSPKAESTDAAPTATAGWALVGIGPVALLITAGVAAAYIWFSKQVPETCNTGMSNYFLLMGVLAAISVVPNLCLVFAAVKGLNAVHYDALMEQHKAEGVDYAGDEGKLRQEAGFAMIAGGGAACVLCLLWPIQSGVGIYGLVQAIKADSAKCGNAVTVFWVLFVLSILSNCIASCSRPSTSGGPVTVPADQP